MKGFMRQRGAQTALAEMVTEAERGLTVRTTATVGELLEAWFDFASPDFSPKTVKETRGYIDRSLMPALGSRRLAKLKPADPDAFYRRLLTSGGSGGRPLAPGTVKRIQGILRRALNQGVKWGWIGINPATATTPPRVPASDIQPPSPEALGRVLRRAEVDSPDLACDLMLAAATGAGLGHLRMVDTCAARRQRMSARLETIPSHARSGNARTGAVGDVANDASAVTRPLTRRRSARSAHIGRPAIPSQTQRLPVSFLRLRQAAIA